LDIIWQPLHTPREGVAALEEALELLAGVVVEQDGLGPAFPAPSTSP
jgi:hypothetical protein